MFTDSNKMHFGFAFIAVFLLAVGIFLFLGWRQGEKIENQETTSIVDDLEVMTGQLAR